MKLISAYYEVGDKLWIGCVDVDIITNPIALANVSYKILYGNPLVTRIYSGVKFVVREHEFTYGNVMPKSFMNVVDTRCRINII